MEGWVVGLIGIVILLVLIAFRVHVAFALAIVGGGGYFFLMGWRPTAGPRRPVGARVPRFGHRPATGAVWRTTNPAPR